MSEDYIGGVETGSTYDHMQYSRNITCEFRDCGKVFVIARHRKETHIQCPYCTKMMKRSVLERIE